MTAVPEPKSPVRGKERRRRPLWPHWSRTSETPEVHYTPRDGGFELRLVAGGLELTARGAGFDTEPEVTGDEELT